MNPREIGRVLKGAREKKGFTLDGIWNTTRIQSKIAEALEEGTADNILARIYVLLFLKKYAAFLGLDGAGLVEDYKAFYTAPEEQILTIDEKPPAINIDMRKWMLLAVSSILLFMSIYFILLLGVRLTSFYRARKAQKATAPIARETISEIQSNKEAQKIFPIPKNRAIDVTLKSTDRVWMKAWRDGKVVFEGTLGKNGTKNWSAKDKISLWTGRGEALNFTINGIAVGRVGRGNIKNIEISRNGLKVRKKWLLQAKK